MHSARPHIESEALTFKGNNRRSHQRFAMCRKMAYRVTGPVSRNGWKQGTVLDMSATGIRFETANPLPEGAVIDVVLDWPGIYHGRDEVRLFLKGTVCRIGLEGVALEITGHDFRFAPAGIPNRLGLTQRRLAVA